MFDLIVIQPFGEFSAGQRITDQQKIQAVLASENTAHVVQVPKESADK